MRGQLIGCPFFGGSMKVKEAINSVNLFKPNTFSDDEKIKWLGTCDMQLIPFYSGYTDEYAKDFTGHTDAESTLLIPSPYADELYKNYLCMQISLNSKEINDYNNELALYNQALAEYRIHYNATHTHKQPDFRW